MIEAEKSGTEQKKRKIKIHYLKSNFFRVIHMDGVFGGLSPQGALSVGIYSERRPLPDLVIQELDEETGQLGKEVKRVSKDGVLRELEANLIIDLEVARTFRDWLTRHLEQAEQLKVAAKATETQQEDEH